MASKPRYLGLAVAVLGLAFAVPAAIGGHAVGGVDVKVVDDNNNVNGGTPTPSFDAKNRQQNETSVAISPVDSDIVAAAANDYRMVPVTADVWYGLYVSGDGGSSWFNTMVPGFPSDTTAAGTQSPLFGLGASGDPVVRFDAAGNLYATGIAFNRSFSAPDRPLDTVVYVARYDYTPGTPAGASTPNSAGNPPNFTYVRTTIVERAPWGSRSRARSVSPARSPTRSGWRSTSTRPRRAPARGASTLRTRTSMGSSGARRSFSAGRPTAA